MPNDPVIVAAQTIVVALLVFAGQYVVARYSKKAHSESTEVDAQEKATTAWKDYALEMKSRLDNLEDRLGRAERRVSSLEHEKTHDRDLIRALIVRLRAAQREVQRLGGAVQDADLEVVDLAQHRLDVLEEDIP